MTAQTQSARTLLAASAQFAGQAAPLAGLLSASADVQLPTLPVGVPAAGGGHRHARADSGSAGTGQHGGDSPVGAAPAAGSSPQPAKPDTFAAGRDLALQPSYRAGYGAYLRAAGLGEIAAVAIPGFTGILVLTGAGGLLGYRQARAGHAVRSGNSVRFLS